MNVLSILLSLEHFVTGIGCAGEIKIREEEDYDKWAIDILVKFRDDEKLQVLTAQRQSGGVRAVVSPCILTLIVNELRSAL
jgi:tRNA(Phe) wybutosine-synthesizing methylase Tyw3